MPWAGSVLRPSIERDDLAGLDAIPEAAPVCIPADWTADDLADALWMTTMFSYGISNVAAGRVLNQITRAIVVLSASKLRELDG